MTTDRWKEIKGEAKEKFSVEEEGREELKPGYMEYLVFESPAGKMRLEFYEKPRVEGKKMITSRRAGGMGKEEYIYGDENVCFVKAYRWVENDWQEFDYPA